ncbi:MAG: ABC transporter permease [Devosia sp.]|nr:ABC transporter permease [Devosia sp.]
MTDTPLATPSNPHRQHLFGFLLRRSPLAVVLVGVFMLAAIFGPWLAPHSMTDTNLSAALQGPSATYWLGTDPLGRDVLSRLLGSAQVAAQAFIIVVLIGGVFGTALGLLAGGLGGWLDLVVSRLVEVLQGFPTILVAIVIVALFDPSLTNAMIAVGMAAVPDFARVSRSVAIQLRDREFIQAARGLGAGELRILWSEVLPNMVGPLIVIASFDGAQAVLWEASLSFLGMGVQPPAPSFGSMLREAQGYLAIQPLFAAIVGLAVSGVILGLNLMGDAINDYLDRGGK